MIGFLKRLLNPQKSGLMTLCYTESQFDECARMGNLVRAQGRHALLCDLPMVKDLLPELNYDGVEAGIYGGLYQQDETQDSIQLDKEMLQTLSLYHSPKVYMQESDTHWRQACDREMMFAHETVAICDVSLKDSEVAEFRIIGPLQTQLNQAKEFETANLGSRINVSHKQRQAVWAELVEQARALGGGAIGIKAFEGLEIENGIMPDLTEDEGQGFVGFKPIGAVQKVLAGSLVFEVGMDATGNVKGHAARVCYSPKLGHMISQGFIQDGQKRIGEHIRLVDLVRGFDTLCEITPARFIALSFDVSDREN